MSKFLNAKRFLSSPNRQLSAFKLIASSGVAILLSVASHSISAETRVYGEDVAVLTGSFQQGTLLQGQLLQGKLLQGEPLQGTFKKDLEINVNGQTINMNSNGIFVLGFGRDAKLENKFEVRSSGNLVLSDTIKLSKREYKTQSIKGVPQKTVNPPKERLERIKLETGLVRKARTIDSRHDYFAVEFKAPIEAPITGVFGSQRIYNGVPKRPHYGVDYAAPTGTPVYAPANAVVTLTHDDMYYSGGTLIVDHGYGVSSTFIHLSEILVKEGDVVQQGQEIARVGSGGRSTGPHLDWRVNWYQERVDPLLVLKKNN